MIGENEPAPSMAPIEGSDEDHAPPGVEDEKVDATPVQVKPGPEIAEGTGYTVTVVVAKSTPSEYVISVVPAATPTTVPVADPTNATDRFEEVQVPPGVGLLSVVLEPSHITVAPVIGGSTANEKKLQNSIKASRPRFFISIVFNLRLILYMALSPHHRRNFPCAC